MDTSRVTNEISFGFYCSIHHATQSLNHGRRPIFGHTCNEPCFLSASPRAPPRSAPSAASPPGRQRLSDTLGQVRALGSRMADATAGIRHLHSAAVPRATDAPPPSQMLNIVFGSQTGTAMVGPARKWAWQLTVGLQGFANELRKRAKKHKGVEAKACRTRGRRAAAAARLTRARGGCTGDGSRQVRPG
jgi:hypothetical protein